MHFRNETLTEGIRWPMAYVLQHGATKCLVWISLYMVGLDLIDSYFEYYGMENKSFQLDLCSASIHK